MNPAILLSNSYIGISNINIDWDKGAVRKKSLWNFHTEMIDTHRVGMQESDYGNYRNIFENKENFTFLSFSVVENLLNEGNEVEKAEKMAKFLTQTATPTSSRTKAKF